MNVSKETVNFLTDTIDEIVTMYYNYYNDINIENNAESKDNEIRINYLQALTYILESYMNDDEIEADETIEKQILDKFAEIDTWFSTHTVNSEELRKALLLLNIKGFKQVNFSLDMITPDAVGMLLVHLVSAYFSNNEKINIIDPNIGTGNLIALINNYLPNEVEFTGIENHEILANLLSAEANFMEMNCNIYLQDALTDTFTNHDILVCDIASYQYDDSNYKSELKDQGIDYFPYLLIEKFLSHKNAISKQIYIIDYDFFEQPGSDKFKDFLKTKAIIKSIIALPSSMFLSKDFTKGILILETLDEANKNTKTGVYMLPSLNDTVSLNKILNEIKKDLKK